MKKDCRALGSDSVAMFPASRPRLKVAKKSFQMLILVNEDGEILLERRPPSGIWGGLWALPANDDGRDLQQRLGIDTAKLQLLPSLKHQLTHIEMTIQPLICHSEPVARGVECTSDQNWFGPDEWPALGLPKPVRQILETQESGRT